MSAPQVVDIAAGEWREHARFKGILMKGLLSTEDNSLASVNVVRVPLGGIIGRHHHATQCETVYVLAGESLLTLGDTQVSFNAGQVVAIPPMLDHALQNNGSTLVELLTFFTPPLI